MFLYVCLWNLPIFLYPLTLTFSYHCTHPLTHPETHITPSNFSLPCLCSSIWQVSHLWDTEVLAVNPPALLDAIVQRGRQVNNIPHTYLMIGGVVCTEMRVGEVSDLWLLYLPGVMWDPDGNSLQGGKPSANVNWVVLIVFFLWPFPLVLPESQGSVLPSSALGSSWQKPEW